MKDIFLLITTVPQSLNFYKGQVQVLKSKYHIEVASSPGQRLDSFGEVEDVPVHSVPMKREISIFSDLQSLYRLYRLIKKLKPKVVHASTPKAGFLGMLAAYLNKTPVRIYFVLGLRYEGTKGFKRRFLMWMESLSCKLATHVFAVSKGTRKTLLDEKITSKEVRIIWNGSINGINPNQFDVKATPKAAIDHSLIPEGSFVFGYVGRLVGDKGTNELIEAFTTLHQSHPEIRLLLIGDFEDVQDPVSDRTRSLIKNHSAIIYAGYQSDVKPFFKLMDVFVFPSYREGFGMVVMEAAAMEKPVICSDITGCNEIIIDGQTGILIPPRSTEMLLRAMNSLRTRPELLEKLSTNARESVIQRYEQQTLWKHSLEAYREITT
ncbi:glycosyltransferase family 4 protein [Galbibacter sp.]|uniref:glycosyltransferase family 4 protein n=1 Tax=Galbibacter sp. TaxID=2918471 RepID=UPI002D14C1F0|nr:glycosyltransferase family 4 protein [Galbibacter sp.]HLV62937.1 glycosyltransferase family 4 protein [Galbibacter sp.]